MYNSYTPDYTKAFNYNNYTLQDVINQGYSPADALRLVGGSLEAMGNPGADYIKYFGGIDAAAQKLGITANKTGTAPTYTADSLKALGFNQEQIYTMLTGNKVDVSKPYSWDANGNPVYETSTQNSTQQSGSQVTQTYTMNGQTYTTPPGGSVPVGGTKISDSTGTYQQVSSTPATPLNPNDPAYQAYLASHPNLTSTPPSGISTSTTQTGGSILSGQLSLNSTDTAGVKALQTFLNSQGANLTVDGKFGPLTQTAVKNYQSSNGLQADGIVGPLTIAKINGSGTQSVGLAPTGNPQSNSGTQTNSAINFQSTGNPQVDAALANMQKLIDQMSKTGQIPPGLQITDAITSQFLAAAHQAVDPQTQQYIKSAVTDLNANLQNQGTQFQNQQGQIIQDFGTQLGQEQNQAGASGTAFSGLRNLGEQRMVNSTNRSLASLGAQTAYNMGGALRTGAGAVGSDNTSQFSLPSLNGLSVSNSGGQYGSVLGNGGLNYNYNPSLYTIGSLNSAGATNVGNTYANYLSRYSQLAQNQSNSGRTWQDLANQAINSGNIGSN